MQVRFHGKTSGLHLLGRSDRTDHRNEGIAFHRTPPVLVSIVDSIIYLPVIGGVWHLPRVRQWPRAKDDVAHLLQEEHDVAMPPMHVQEHLVDLYFTYMHPSLPVIHKAQFLADWKAIRHGLVNVPPPPHSPPSLRLWTMLFVPFIKQSLMRVSKTKF